MLIKLSAHRSRSIEQRLWHRTFLILPRYTRLQDKAGHFIIIGTVWRRWSNNQNKWLYGTRAGRNPIRDEIGTTA
jgi:hypothetical protein